MQQLSHLLTPASLAKGLDSDFSLKDESTFRTGKECLSLLFLRQVSSEHHEEQVLHQPVQSGGQIQKKEFEVKEKKKRKKKNTA